MANPIRLYVIPNCGVEIDVESTDLFQWSKHNSTKPFRYTLKNIGDLSLNDGISVQESFEGWMSPLNLVTLPKAVKKGAGIPADANFFAYVYPPNKLASRINWDEFDGTIHTVEADRVNKWALPFIAGLGGYAYFDRTYRLLSVNAISTMKTMFDLKLSGPFSTSDESRKELQALNRVHSLTSQLFHEVGYVSSAWVHPSEKFPFKQVTEQYKNIHGAFVFYRQNHSAVTYCIDPTGFLDPTGDTTFLDDAFHEGKMLYKYATVYEHYTSDNDKRIQEDMNLICNGEHGRIEKLTKDDKTLLHLACRAKCDAATIHHLIHYVPSEEGNLTRVDTEYGWTPLHFACCFQPNNFELISMLINLAPRAVLQKDKCDRFPLHIACDNLADEKVITALLQADLKNVAIFQPSKLFERLPIHIALNRGCGANVIALLLKRDKEAEMLYAQTKTERLPLHIAVEKKLSHEIIDLLLFGYEGRNGESADLDPDKCNPDDVHTSFAGNLPIHVACWNNSSYETIKLLLEKDFGGSTIYDEVGYDSIILQGVIASLEKEMVKDSRDIHDISSFEDIHIGSLSNRMLLAKKSMKVKSIANEYLTILTGAASTFETLAIHLAMNHGNFEVIKLLLEKENGRSNILVQDHQGRTPLAIATLNNVDCRIIDLLLELDSGGYIPGEITRKADILGSFPIHHECDSSQARGAVIKTLISAEERYLEIYNGLSMTTRSTNCLDGQGRSPLSIALKAGAPSEVIEILLQSQNFSLIGLDSSLKTDLAKMAVSEGPVQREIINKLSDRCYFCLLVLDVYIYAYALAAFMVASERLLLGNLTARGPITLLLCVMFFIVREFIQIRSQSFQYFYDPWSWLQLLGIGLLSYSTFHMLMHADGMDIGIDRLWLLANGTCLTVQAIVTLKSVFLPFARFVGGLVTIMLNLFPFFVVSFLTLLTFAYSFWMSGTREDSCQTLETCFLSVLQGFFSGADETKDFLDVLYGIVVILVLLNVLIAIVGEAWQKTTDDAKYVFWKFRIDFLSESSQVAKSDFGNKFTRRLSDSIDFYKYSRFVDLKSWRCKPYNMVTSRAQYNRPYDYFMKDDADKIIRAKSLQADLYWLRKERKRLKEAKEDDKCLFFSWPKVVIKWIFFYIMDVMLLILGILSAGWFWPKEIRKKLLKVGL